MSKYQIVGTTFVSAQTDSQLFCNSNATKLWPDHWKLQKNVSAIGGIDSSPSILYPKPLLHVQVKSFWSTWLLSLSLNWNVTFFLF